MSYPKYLKKFSVKVLVDVKGISHSDAAKTAWLRISNAKFHGIPFLVESKDVENPEEIVVFADDWMAQ